MKRLFSYIVALLIGISLALTGSVWAGSDSHRNKNKTITVIIRPMQKPHGVHQYKQNNYRHYKLKHYRKKHHRDRHNNFRVTNFRYNRDFQTYSAF